MMSTDRAFATATKSTPKGHLTEAEVTDLADKANAAAGLTSALEAALRECLVEAPFLLSHLCALPVCSGLSLYDQLLLQGCYLCAVRL